MKVTVEIPDGDQFFPDDAHFARFVDNAVQKEYSRCFSQQPTVTVYWVQYGGGDVLMAFNKDKGVWEASS
jgi:hypothetical protein